MRLDVPLKTLFIVESSAFTAIKNKVESLDKEEWDKNTFRQESFPVHAQTKSIVLKFQSMDGPAIKHVEVYDKWHEWSEVLGPIMDQAAEAITGRNDGVIIKAMLAMVPPGCSISPHKDVHWTFDRAHRIHLPIATSDEVDFTIDGQVYHLEESLVYEINNKLEHSVKNGGGASRIHLIFDYVTGDVWNNWEMEG
jgi:hypothetical protein